ncbi:hypothetical protein HK098_003085, partial [Nowakowskiella sp. JEL0407]
NLKVLSLTGNELTDHLCFGVRDAGNENIFPENLEVLHLNANRLTKFPKVSYLKNLVHLGLAYNKITSLSPLQPQRNETVTKTNKKESRKLQKTLSWIPESIQSVDLSFNELVDVEELCCVFGECRNLKSLCLLGNPLCLYENYEHYILSKLKNLQIFNDNECKFIHRQFDDSVITKFDQNPVKFEFKIISVSGIPPIPIPPTQNSDDKPPDEFTYSIQISFQPNPISTITPLKITTQAIKYPEEEVNPSDSTTQPPKTTFTFEYAKISGILFTLIQTRLTAAPITPTIDSTTITTTTAESRPQSAKKTAKKPVNATTKKPGNVVDPVDQNSKWSMKEIHNIVVAEGVVKGDGFLSGTKNITDSIPLSPSKQWVSTLSSIKSSLLQSDTDNTKKPNANVNPTKPTKSGGGAAAGTNKKEIRKGTSVVTDVVEWDILQVWENCKPMVDFEITMHPEANKN